MNFLAIATMIIEMYSSVAGLASHYDTLSMRDKSKVLGSEVRIVHELEKRGISLNQTQRDDFYSLLRSHGLRSGENEKILGQFFYGCEHNLFEEAADKVVSGYAGVCNEAEAMDQIVPNDDDQDTVGMIGKVVNAETNIMRAVKPIGTIRHADLSKRDLFIKNLRKYCRNHQAVRRNLQANLKLNGYKPDKVAGKRSLKK